MSVYTLGVVLEDPFDTGAQAAPDTLSLTEFMHTLAYVSVYVVGGGVGGRGVLGMPGEELEGVVQILNFTSGDCQLRWLVYCL